MNTQQLRQKVLDLAIHGKLVAQNPNEEPASALLERIKAEKERLVKEKKIKKKDLQNTPIEDINKPFEIPNNWEWVHLTDIGELNRGKSKHRPRNDQSLFEGGTIPFVQTGDVARSDKFILSTYSFYNEKGLNQSRLWPKGTICLTIAANIGDVAMLDFDACFPDSVVGFNGFQNISENSYVMYSLKWYKNLLDDLSRATAQKNINLEILSNIPFPLPPLEEQKRIVAEIEKWMHLIDIIEENQNGLNDNIEKAKAKILDLAVHGKLGVTSLTMWQKFYSYSPHLDKIDYFCGCYVTDGSI